MKSILYIDDDELLREIYISSFKTSGYMILQAYCGTQALKIAQEEKPDLIISDIMMPEMDGFELLKNIRNDPNTSGIPVIFFTASRSDEYKARAKELEVTGYYEKPVKPKDLILLIKPFIGD